MKIRYELLNFQSNPSMNNVVKSLDVTIPQLLHAAYTVGKRSSEDVYSHPYYSNKEIEFRISMVEAFFCEHNNYLNRSPIYEDLDPSEKAAMNYFNGLMVSKLFCEKLFGFPWMMHLDVYVKKGYIRVETERGKSRPDLIGLNQNNNWLVMEAKGRRKRNIASLDSAVEQSKKIRSINGQIPKLRLGSILFESPKNQIQMMIKDPPDFDKKFVDLELNPSELLYDYYSSVWVYLHQYELSEQEIGNLTFFIAEIPCFNIKIGLEKEIYTYLRKSYDTA